MKIGDSMFYLEEVTESRRNEILDYVNEFKKYNSELNGTGGFDKILDGSTFEECLQQIINLRDRKYAKDNNRCPGNTFCLIREEDNKIVGMINVRYDLNEKLLNFGGHIGYSIRPTERRKGYNKINLYLGLIEAKKFNLDKVMLDCSVDNLGSDRTIQALGGVLERCGVDPYDNTLTNVYWIDVDDSLNKYKDIYEPYISSRR